MQRCYSCMKEYGKEYDVCPYCGYIVGTKPESKSHLLPGTTLAGRYTVGKAVGHGGFGITYIAWDGRLQKTVAVKEYFPNAFSTRSEGDTQISCLNADAERFFISGVKKMLDEARRISLFSKNENIVDIYDFFEASNTAYIVMEYLEGENLKQYLEENGGKLAPKKAVELILPVLNALEDMHKEHLIHRDISPDNIYLCNDGKVKLLDFGSARLAIEDSDKSLSVMIKRGYAPREQYASRSKQGPWTDVYAVCATLYKMITGETPVESTDRDDEELKTFSELGINGCDELEKIILKGMAIKPADRIQSVQELRAQLSGAGKSEIKKEPEKQENQQPEKRKKNNGKIIGIIAAVIVAAGIAAAVFALKPWETEPDKEAQSAETSIEAVITEVPSTQAPTTVKPSLTEAELKAKIEKHTGKKIYEYFYDDFDKNGTKEMFAMFDDEENDDLISPAIGELWFADASDITRVSETVVCMFTVFNSGKRIYILHSKSVNGIGASLQYVTTVINGKPVTLSEEYGFGYGPYMFDSDTIAWTVYADDAMRWIDNSGEYIGGHTFKPYFFDETPDGLTEHGAKKISREEFLKYRGTQQVLEEIENDGYIVTGFLLRANNLLHLNYENVDEEGKTHYFCLTFTLYANKADLYIDDFAGVDDGEEEYIAYKAASYSGTYLPAATDKAVYPD